MLLLGQERGYHIKIHPNLKYLGDLLLPPIGPLHMIIFNQDGGEVTCLLSFPTLAKMANGHILLISQDGVMTHDSSMDHRIIQ